MSIPVFSAIIIYIYIHNKCVIIFIALTVWFITFFCPTKAEEEARALQKKIQTIENELDQTQEALMQVNAKLEEKDKALQNVSYS